MTYAVYIGGGQARYCLMERLMRISHRHDDFATVATGLDKADALDIRRVTNGDAEHG